MVVKEKMFLGLFLEINHFVIFLMILSGNAEEYESMPFTTSDIKENIKILLRYIYFCMFRLRANQALLNLKF